MEPITLIGTAAMGAAIACAAADCAGETAQAKTAVQPVEVVKAISMPPCPVPLVGVPHQSVHCPAPTAPQPRPRCRTPKIEVHPQPAVAPAPCQEKPCACSQPVVTQIANLGKDEPPQRKRPTVPVLPGWITALFLDGNPVPERDAGLLAALLLLAASIPRLVGMRTCLRRRGRGQ